MYLFAYNYVYIGVCVCVSVICITDREPGKENAINKCKPFL